MVRFDSTRDNAGTDKGAPTAVIDLPMEPVGNVAPVITDTSYSCDPVTESVWFTVGQIDTFTLSDDDEFLPNMKYSADSSFPDSVEVTTDEYGIFTIKALQAGVSDVWLSVTNHEGLVE